MVSVEYLAGFTDGEGYLGIARIPRSRAPEYCLRVSLYNTNRQVLDEIRQSWGGAFSAVGQRRAGWKPSYALIWTNASAGELLRKLAPHLRVKSEQVAALLVFQEHIRAFRRTRDSRGRLLPIPAEEVEHRESVYQYVKLLNTRDNSVRRRNSTRPARPARPRRISPRYLAGFFDGEGSIMISKYVDASSGRPQYRPRISIANTDKVVLEDIQRLVWGPPRK